MSLLNKKKVKQYALEIAASRHHKFNRVSGEFVIFVEGIVKTKIREYIQSLPSVGKTIKVIFLALALASPAYAEVGKASWYSFESCRREGTSGFKTANGENFNENAMTCALRRRDWGKSYKVTNLANGKSVVVRHNDFGPGRKPTAKGVVIDLSAAAFRQIADPKQGLVKVSVEAV